MLTSIEGVYHHYAFLKYYRSLMISSKFILQHRMPSPRMGGPYIYWKRVDYEDYINYNGNRPFLQVLRKRI